MSNPGIPAGFTPSAWGVFDSLSRFNLLTEVSAQTGGTPTAPVDFEDDNEPLLQRPDGTIFTLAGEVVPAADGSLFVSIDKGNVFPPGSATPQTVAARGVNVMLFAVVIGAVALAAILKR